MSFGGPSLASRFLIFCDTLSGPLPAGGRYLPACQGHFRRVEGTCQPVRATSGGWKVPASLSGPLPAGGRYLPACQGHFWRVEGTCQPVRGTSTRRKLPTRLSLHFIYLFIIPLSSLFFSIFISCSEIIFKNSNSIQSRQISNTKENENSFLF